MNIAFLNDFARKVSQTGRITTADVAALRNHGSDEAADADGLGVADAMFAIDGAAQDKSAEWAPFFVDTLVDIVVWGERPTGVVNAAMADWLLSRMTMDGARATGVHQALLVALVREAQSCDPRIAAAAFGYDAPKADRAPVALTLGWLDASGVSV